MRLRVIVFILLGGALLVGGSPAGATQEQASARNLYQSYPNNPKRGAPGLRVRVKLRREGQERWSAIRFPFRSGDQVKFFLEANYSAYVSVFNLGSSGRLTPLFPYAGARNQLVKQEIYEVPQGGAWIRFDEKPGIEKVIFILSAEPMEESASASPPAAQTSTVTAENQEVAINRLNSQAIQNGKDLEITSSTESSSTESYVFVNQATIRKPRRFVFTLQHR